MKLIVFLSLLVGSALAAVSGNHANVTVYTVPQVRDDIRYGAHHPPGQGFGQHHSVCLSELKHRPFIFVYPTGASGKLSAVYVTGGFQGLNLAKYPQFDQTLLQGEKYLVLGYPWELPRNVVEQISVVDIIASAHHGQVGIPQLPQFAAEVSSQPILLAQARTGNQLVREEQLKEAGTIQVTSEGNVQVLKDLVVEQNYKYGSFYNPYGFSFQGYNTGHPFNYGYDFQSQYPYYGFQAQYPSYAFQGQYPGYAFQSQHPYYGFQAQYPYYGYPNFDVKAQYPGYGFQGQTHNYGPAAKHHGSFHAPAFPGYNNFYPGYYGSFPNSYFYPGVFGNSFGYNVVPNHYVFGNYPAYPFYFYGQRTQQGEHQEQGTRCQFGSCKPFAFYDQQPQYQYGYQYQGYPSNYQYYPYAQPAAKVYQYQQYTPYPEYQPFTFQQYQPYQHQPYQHEPYQYQPYQYYQNFYSQYYPTF